MGQLGIVKKNWETKISIVEKLLLRAMNKKIIEH